MKIVLHKLSRTVGVSADESSPCFVAFASSTGTIEMHNAGERRMWFDSRGIHSGFLGGRPIRSLHSQGPELQPGSDEMPSLLQESHPRTIGRNSSGQGPAHSSYLPQRSFQVEPSK